MCCRFGGRAACLAVLLLISPLQIRAEPASSAIAEEITDNVAAEYVTCAAYFAVVQGGLIKGGATDGAEKYAEASTRAAERGLLAAQQSRSDEMAAKVTIARFQNSLADMMRVIENDYSNIALLSSEHGESCLAAMNDPDGLIERWSEKIVAKYSVETAD